MVYLDSPVCEWHWIEMGLSTISDKCSAAVFHVPFPFNDQFRDRVHQAITKYENIIILCSELHRDSVEFIKQTQHPSIHYFTCGTIYGVHTNQWMDWFVTTAVIYRYNNLLNQLTPYVTKPKYFDALLGWKKPHRQIIFDKLQNNNKIILTYLQHRHQPLKESGWIETEDCEINENVRNTVTRVNYYDQEVSISQIIPFKVYNETAYSIVAETNYDNDYSFYTEKIVKPILAERLFIVFSGQYYLRNLRELGFKTFDGIIDEGYDNIEDSNMRFKLALEQVEYLINQPQEKILEQIRSITEHNKTLMMRRLWQSETHLIIRNIIMQYK